MKTTMQYIFTGFRDTDAVRRFAFDRVAADRSLTKVSVYANMALAREHRILLQDLPLLCLRLLESDDEVLVGDSITFSEARMVAIRNAARTATERKPLKKHRPSPALGQAWRNGPPPAATAQSAAVPGVGSQGTE